MTTPKRSPFRLRTLPVALFLVIAFSQAVASSAQEGAQPKSPAKHRSEKPYALIYGTVFGPDDRAVYGVNIKIRRSSDKKARWELYSDHRGEFAQRVPPGPQNYVVWADLKGYKPPDGKRLRLAQEVTIHLENEERADVSLHLKY